MWIYVIYNPYLECFGCKEVQGLYHLCGNLIWWLRLWNQLHVLIGGSFIILTSCVYGELE